jgi:hypothetical protein
MIAGILLIAFGLIGLAFTRNRYTTASREIEPKGKQDSNRATKKVDWSLPPEVRKPG